MTKRKAVAITKYSNVNESLYSGQFRKVMLDEQPEFAEYILNQQLMNNIWLVMNHMIITEHNKNPDASSITVRKLKKLLGRNKYEEIMAKFSVKLPAQCEPRVSTAQRVFSPKWEQLIMEYGREIVKNGAKSVVESASIDTDVSTDNSSKSNATVERFDIAGVRKTSDIQFYDNKIAYNRIAALKLLEFVKYCYDKNDIDRYNTILETKSLKSIADIKRSYKYLVGFLESHDEDGLLLTYKELTSGRLLVTHLYNPQNMKSELRAVIFSNLGYCDFDLSNTNFTFMYVMYFYYRALAEMRNLWNVNHTKYNSKIKIPDTELPVTKEYLANKQMFRMYVANDLKKLLGIKVTDNFIKSILIPITGGCRMGKLPDHINKINHTDIDIIKAKYESGKYSSDVFEACNYNIPLYNAILAHPKIMKLHDEITIITNFCVKIIRLAKGSYLCANTHKGKEYVFNLNDKKYCISDNSIAEDERELITSTNIGIPETPIKNRLNKASLMVHMIQGFEVIVVECVLSECITPENVKSILIIFDGFLILGDIPKYKDIIQSIKKTLVQDILTVGGKITNENVASKFIKAVDSAYILTMERKELKFTLDLLTVPI